MSILSVMGLLAALEVGGGASLSVRSDCYCPSADAVSAALRALGGEQPPRPASANVRCRGDELTIAFAGVESAASEARTVAVPADCEARARLAAVVIASWLGILPEATPAIPVPRGASPVAAVSPAALPSLARVPAERRSADADAAGISAAAAEPGVGTVAAPVPDRSDRAWLGFGLGGAAGGGVVAGLRIELLRTYRRGDFGFGWLASTVVALPRDVALAAGTSSWLRPAVGLAGVASWGGSRLRVALDAGPLFGLTVAWGGGYPDNHTDDSPTWGLGAGLRVQRAWAWSTVWIDLRVIDWLRAQSLQHDIQPVGIVGSAELPSFEAMLSLGWSFPI